MQNTFEGLPQNFCNSLLKLPRQTRREFCKEWVDPETGLAHAGG